MRKKEEAVKHWLMHLIFLVKSDLLDAQSETMVTSVDEIAKRISEE
jgi:hypothetical protein